MGFQGLSPFSAQSPFAGNFASPQAFASPMAQSPFSGMMPGMNASSFGSPMASMQGNPMMGMQNQPADTQALFLQISTMMLGVMTAIVGVLAGILSGAISGKAPAGQQSATMPASSTSAGGDKHEHSGNAPTGSTGEVVNNPMMTPGGGNYTLPITDKGLYKNVSGLNFGSDRDNGSRKHKGLDILAPEGTPIHAIGEGEVIRVVPTDDGNTAGIRIGIKHPNGDISYYYHNKEISANPATGKPWAVGDKVKSGQQIALVGKTGTHTPHLHFELWRGGAAVDPWENLFKHLLGK